MATTTNITTTYAGQDAFDYVAAAVRNSPTISNGGITIDPNIKFRKTLRPANLQDIISDATCDFTATGSVTTLERVLEPKELQVNQVFCKSDFQDTWDALEMGFSAHDVLPKTFSDFIIAEYIARVAEANELAIWGGVNGSGQYDGFKTLIAADANLPASQEIGSTSIDASNVIDEMAKVYNAIPDRLFGKEDLYIYVSSKVFRAYKLALGGFAAGGVGANGVNGQGTNQDINIETFSGVKVFMTQGLIGDEMIATRKQNLHFGTGLLSDHNEVKVLDMADLDGSKNVRFVMRYTAGVQYEFAQDFVTYGVTNSAND